MDLEDGFAVLLSDITLSGDILAQAIKRANALKAHYNVHIASTDYHQTADTANPVSSADATDESTLVTLVNEIRTDYEAHRVLVGVGPVHGSADTTHVVSVAAATDLATAVELLKDLFIQYQAHRKDVSGSPAIHATADKSDLVFPYLKGVAHYGGSLEEIPDLRAKLVEGAPMALVKALPFLPSSPQAGGAHTIRPQVVLILVDNSCRGPSDQLRGSGLGDEPPGIYNMVEHAQDRIIGKQPVDINGIALDIGRWRIASIDSLVADEDLQVWYMVFQSEGAQQFAHVDRATLDDLQRADGLGNLYADDVKVFDSLEKIRNDWP